MRLRYGPGLDCCVCYRMGGKWVESDRPMLDSLPKFKPGLDKDGRDLWVLSEDFSVRLGTKVYSVKAGIDFNGANIPGFLRHVLGPVMGVRKIIPSLIHDSLYSSHLVDRSVADRVFRDLLDVYDTASGIFRRYLCYVGVRLFGSRSYRVSGQDPVSLQRYKQYIVIDKIA